MTARRPIAGLPTDYGSCATTYTFAKKVSGETLWDNGQKHFFIRSGADMMYGSRLNSRVHNITCCYSSTAHTARIVCGNRIWYRNTLIRYTSVYKNVRSSVVEEKVLAGGFSLETSS